MSVVSICACSFFSFSQYVGSDGPSNSTKAFQVGDVAVLGATERVQTSFERRKTTFRQKDKFPEMQENVAAFDLLAQPRADNG